MNIAQEIQSRRKAAGLSQEELALKLHVSRQAVSKWEAGSALPSIDNLSELSGLFGVSVDVLLGRPQQEAEAPGEEWQANWRRMLQEQGKKTRHWFVYSAVLAVMALVVAIGGLLLGMARNHSLETRYQELLMRVGQLGQPMYISDPSQQGEYTLLSLFHYNIGSIDKEKNQAVLSLRAMPKEYKQGTQMVFTARDADGKTYDAKGEETGGNWYEAQLTVPLSDTLEITLALDDAGEIRTEPLAHLSGLRAKVFHQLSATIMSSYTHSEGTLRLSGNIIIHVYLAQEEIALPGIPKAYPVSGQLELIADDEVIKRWELEDDLNMRSDNGTEDEAPQLAADITLYVPSGDTSAEADLENCILRLTLVDQNGEEYVVEEVLGK